MLEYFISTHGARKGLADTALKTADAGYLTRRLVDVAQDVIITEDDCGTIRGLVGRARSRTARRSSSRCATACWAAWRWRTSCIRSRTRSSCRPAKLIDEAVAARIDEAAKAGPARRSASARCSPASRGAASARKCYGRNLATGRMVDLGEAVGVIAAQSIGEPGTQLTLRTFHIGGTASRIVEQSRTKAKDARHAALRGPRRRAVTSARAARPRWPSSTPGEIELLDDEGRVRQRYTVPYGAHRVRARTADRHRGRYGAVRVGHLQQRRSSREKIGHGPLRRHQGEGHRPRRGRRDHGAQAPGDHGGPQQGAAAGDRHRSTPGGHKLAHYPLPTGARLEVRDGQHVSAGEVVVKIRREASKTRDITGGLPRVAELFEARRPKDAAIVSEIDGTRGVRRRHPRHAQDT